MSQTIGTAETLTIRGVSSELEKIRDFVFGKSIDAGFSELDASKIVLAVDEACSNIVRHAYQNDPEREICVEIGSSDGTISIAVLDSGSPFDPGKIPSPDMVEYLRTFKHGGLGIHLMRKIMDSVEYLPSEGTAFKNILRMTKVVNKTGIIR